MYVLRTYIQPGECNFVNFLIKHSVSIDTHTGVPIGSTELIHLFIRLSGTQPDELSLGVSGGTNGGGYPRHHQYFFFKHCLLLLSALMCNYCTYT